MRVQASACVHVCVCKRVWKQVRVFMCVCANVCVQASACVCSCMEERECLNGRMYVCRVV